MAVSFPTPHYKESTVLLYLSPPTIKWSATVTVSYTVLVLEREINQDNVSSAMACSLSQAGVVDDYVWTYGPMESTVSIAAKASYLEERYKAQKTQLEILKERVAGLEQANEYANEIINRFQIYANMGKGRNSISQ